LTAGCRFFTMQEANDHWIKTRSGTKLGRETMDMLTYFKTYIELETE
jgi:hypothetical protein